MQQAVKADIINYVSKFIDLSPDEQALIISKFKPFRAKKRQFIIQPGFVAKHRYFVINGAVRGYVVDENGHEHSVQLAVNEWWISDYNSYMFQQPASMFVMATEDSELLQISFEDEQQLKAFSHNLETFFRIIAERAAAFSQRRFITSITMTAEEKYNSFLESYPAMINRFPQYVIASYLGMSTEFLSRIRNRKVRSKANPKP